MIDTSLVPQRGVLWQYPQDHPCWVNGCRVMLWYHSPALFEIRHYAKGELVGGTKSHVWSVWEDTADLIDRWLRSLHTPAPTEQACQCGCC